MAKKKKEQVIEPNVEAQVEESEVVYEYDEMQESTVNEETIEPAHEAEHAKNKQDTGIEQFIYTQLKIINGMPNQAKARRLAQRVLRNK